ncbi:MAG: hypothetical protein VKP62_00775 [Candidatus Sericytochromatia bacterium]|nr:hypothetical protein [Candidatus Sericytochromatia bacterium]
MPHSSFQRADVLRVLARVVRLGGRGLRLDEVPIQFLEKRIAVVLPADRFTADEQVRLNGKFQHLMTQLGAHAYLDFAENWKGLQTTLDGGFH